MFETINMDQTKAVKAIDVSSNVLNYNIKEVKQEQDIVFDTHMGKSENTAELQEVSQTKIENIAQAMDNYVQSIQRDLKIRVHNDTGNIIVEVLSGDDGTVIREIPPEDLLNLAAKMEEMTGVLFNENA